MIGHVTIRFSGPAPQDWVSLKFGYWICFGLALGLPPCVTGCETREKINQLAQANETLQQMLSATQKQNEDLVSDLRALANENETAQRLNQLRISLNKAENDLAEVAKRMAECDTDRRGLRDQLAKITASESALRQESEQLRLIVAGLDSPLARVAMIEWKWVQVLHGAAVVAQDHDKTYLGVLDFTGNHTDSIFNEFGLHGSRFGLHSVWNDVGFFGSDVGLYSARNDLCLNPPMVVKNQQILGYITTNNIYVRKPRFDPYYLRDLAHRTQGKLGVDP